MKAPMNRHVAEAKKINKLLSLCSLLSALGFYLRSNRIYVSQLLWCNIIFVAHRKTQLWIVLIAVKLGRACGLDLESLTPANKDKNGTWEGSRMHLVQSAGFITDGVRRTKLVRAKQSYYSDKARLWPFPGVWGGHVEAMKWHMASSTKVNGTLSSHLPMGWNVWWLPRTAFIMERLMRSHMQVAKNPGLMKNAARCSRYCDDIASFTTKEINLLWALHQVTYFRNTAQLHSVA